MHGIFAFRRCAMNGIYNIMYGGRQAGKLKVYSEGLKTVFMAETAQLKGVLRLAVVSDGKTVPIGVLSPSGKGLAIKKSYSKNSLTELGITQIDEVVLLGQDTVLPPGSDWSVVEDPAGQFSDPDLKAACKGAQGVLIHDQAEYAELAFPVVNGMPFSLMPAFCLGVPRTIEGREYLIFNIKDGNLSAYNTP